MARDYQIELLEEAPARPHDQFDIEHPSGLPETRTLYAIDPSTGPAWLAAVEGRRPPVRGAVSGVYSSPDPTVACLIIGGDAVLVETCSPPAHRWLTGVSPIIDVLAAVEHDLLLLATPWIVAALDTSGIKWATPRLAMYGIRLDEVAGGMVAGVTEPDDEDPVDFSIDLATGHHSGGRWGH